MVRTFGLIMWTIPKPQGFAAPEPSRVGMPLVSFATREVEIVIADGHVSQEISMHKIAQVHTVPS
jgi:hypothetical protein